MEKVFRRVFKKPMIKVQMYQYHVKVVNARPYRRMCGIGRNLYGEGIHVDNGEGVRNNFPPIPFQVTSLT